MLLAIRSNVGSWLVKILFALLILSFGAWGLNDLFQEPDPMESVVAEVGDQEILLGDVSIRLDRRVENLRRFSDPGFDLRQAVDLGLDQESLDILVVEAILMEMAEEFGLSLSNDFVASQIRNQPIFINSLTNQFDRQQFLRLLAQNGYTEAAYVDVLRGDLLRQSLIDTVARVDYAPDLVTDTLFEFRQERRDADFILIDATSLSVTPVPGDGDLEAFYDENPIFFTAPEYRRLTAITITIDDLIDTVAIPEQDVRDAYDAEINRFITEEQRAFNQALLPDRETADTVVAAARAAGSLEAGLAEVGSDVGLIPLDLAPISSFAVPEVGQAGFAADPEGISDPAESPFGFHVLEVVEILPSGETPFEDVADTLRRELAEQDAIDAVFQLSGELDDALASGNTLEEAAATLNLTLHNVSQVDATGLTDTGSQISIPLGQEIIIEAFAMQEGEESLLLESGLDAYFVVRVDGITDPAVRPFQDVEDDVRIAWTLDQRRQAAGRLAETLADDVSGSADMSERADDFGFSIDSVEGVLRDGTGRGALPIQAVAALFDMDEDEIRPVAVGGNQVVLRLNSIESREPSTNLELREQIALEVALGFGQDLEVQVSDSLRSRYNVTIHRDRLDNLIQQ